MRVRLGRSSEGEAEQREWVAKGVAGAAQASGGVGMANTAVAKLRGEAMIVRRSQRGSRSGLAEGNVADVL